MIPLKDPIKNFTRLKLNPLTGIFENTSKKPIKNLYSVSDNIVESARWATENEFRSGNRTRKSVVENALIGKLGEFAVYKLLKWKGYNPKYPDVSISKDGHDGGIDLTIMDDIGINVKASGPGANTLLLKKSDFDSTGNYNYRKKLDSLACSFFFFVRISPDPKTVLDIDDNVTSDIIIDQLEQTLFQADFPGYLNINDFREIISQDISLKEGQYLNSKKFRIDNEKYYCQTCDLRDIDTIKRIK